MTPRERVRAGACAVILLAATLAASSPTFAQRGSKAEPNAFPDGPGKDVLLSKCFQCHGPSMWMAQRQDRRAWESTLYRMVGRGALWTEDDIRAMADYLGAHYGKDAK